MLHKIDKFCIPGQNKLKKASEKVGSMIFK